MSINLTELEVVERFLAAPWGSDEMSEALDELIRMADVSRKAIEARSERRRAS